MKVKEECGSNCGESAMECRYEERKRVRKDNKYKGK